MTYKGNLLRATPRWHRSVKVLTKDFLTDISAASLFDATQYVSRIGSGQKRGSCYNLNVDNALDKKTICAPSGRVSIAPYPKSNVSLGTSFEF